MRRTAGQLENTDKMYGRLAAITDMTSGGARIGVKNDGNIGTMSATLVANIFKTCAAAAILGTITKMAADIRVRHRFGRTVTAIFIADTKFGLIQLA